jgi:hypothetical protein
MTFIIVKRGNTATFTRLIEAFSDNSNVKVIWDRRGSGTDTGRPKSPLRRLSKPFNRQGYFVVHDADPSVLLR